MANFVEKVGPEFLVNTQTKDWQMDPAIALLSDGGFVVVWRDDSGLGGDNQNTAIKGQRFDAAGGKLGGEFLVNTTTQSSQLYPSVGALPDGRFVVSWADYSGLGGNVGVPSTKAQIFGADGTKLGAEFLVNTTTVNSQGYSPIAGASDGTFVITWSVYDEAARNFDIFAQRFDAAGAKLGPEFTLSAVTAGLQIDPRIVALSGGGYAAAWSDDSRVGGDTSGLAIKAQLLDASGSKIGSEFLVNTGRAGNQGQPTIAALADGGFVIAWTDDRDRSGSAEAIKAQRYDASGNKLGTEIHVTPTASGGPYTEPHIAALSDGGFVVGWSQFGHLDGSDAAAVAQRFSASGAKLGDPLILNDTVIGSQGHPVFAGLADGSFVAAWEDSSMERLDRDLGSIRANIFEPTETNTAPVALDDTETVYDRVQVHTNWRVTWNDGDANGNPLTVTEVNGLAANVGQPVYGPHGYLTLNADGTYLYTVTARQPPQTSPTTEVFTYTIDDGEGGTDTATLTITFHPRPYTPGTPVVGDDGPNNLVGGFLNDHLFGLGGNDRLDGAGNYDVMEGGAGNDIYFVDDGDDQVVERAGEGIDTVFTLTDFALAAGQEVEIIRPARYAGNLSWTGNEFDNTFVARPQLFSPTVQFRMAGKAGDDVYHVNSDRDLVFENAGEGKDTVFTAVSFQLAAGQEIELLRAARDAPAVTLTGNEIVNSLVGGARADTLMGMQGNDHLYGKGGDDRLEGGLGRDVLVGGEGADIFVFDAGDSLASGPGFDTVVDFLAGTDQIDLSAVSGGLSPADYAEAALPATNSFTAAQAVAAGMMAGGAHSVAFVAGRLDGWLFWDTNGDLTTAEGALRLQGLNSLASFGPDSII